MTDGEAIAKRNSGVDHHMPPLMQQAYVYMLANTSRTLYTGITSNLERRVWEHKSHACEGFTKRYNVTGLVWFAEFSCVDDAIAFEKSLKGKSRAKKLALVEATSPRWNDLAWNWFGPEEILGQAEESASRTTRLLRFFASL